MALSDSDMPGCDLMPPLITLCDGVELHYTVNGTAHTKAFTARDIDVAARSVEPALLHEDWGFTDEDVSALAFMVTNWYLAGTEVHFDATNSSPEAFDSWNRGEDMEGVLSWDVQDEIATVLKHLLAKAKPSRKAPKHPLVVRCSL